MGHWVCGARLISCDWDTRQRLAATSAANRIPPLALQKMPQGPLAVKGAGLSEGLFIPRLAASSGSQGTFRRQPQRDRLRTLRGSILPLERLAVTGPGVVKVRLAAMSRALSTYELLAGQISERDE